MNITNEKVTGYINDLYRPLNRELLALRTEQENAKIPVIMRDTEGLLISLIRLIRPEKILEIGTARGYSAACMAAAFPQAHITTVESRPDSCEKAENNLRRLGLGHQVDVVRGDGSEVMREIADRGGVCFDFIFIDAAKSHYKEFFTEALRLSGEGTVILCDNVLLKGAVADERYLESRRDRTSMKRMREFLIYLDGLEEAKTNVLPVGDGVSISHVEK